MNEEYLKKIARFGDEYRQKFLPEAQSRDTLSSIWWQALLFFFGRAYYQGRRDTVSKKVHDASVGVLNQLFADSDKDSTYNRMKSDNWQKLSSQLKVVIGKGKVGKPADIELTIDTFRYIGSIPSKNIVAFSVDQIREGKLKRHYNQLQRSKSSDGIRSVGPKIASFYLRDIVSLFGLEDTILPDDLVLLQPIDTWVRKIAFQVGLIDNLNERDDAVRQKIVEACNRLQLSSLKFNQGAWFMGYHSFEIVLRNLNVIN